MPGYIQFQAHLQLFCKSLDSKMDLYYRQNCKFNGLTKVNLDLLSNSKEIRESLFKNGELLKAKFPLL